MAYIRLSAAEAAAMINDQDTIGLSGFTPNGVPKATFRELSKRAVAEHEAGRPFQVGILTGASTSQSIEGDMAAAHAIKFQQGLPHPYQSRRNRLRGYAPRSHG